MTISIKSTLIRASLSALLVVVAACSPHHVPHMTVADLMEDRVTLDGVLIKCNQNPAKSRTDTDCLNARIAIERLARQSDPEQEAKRAEEFERSREQLRQLQDKQRQEQEAKSKVDAYHLPVVPVEPPQKDPQPPIVGQTNT